MRMRPGELASFIQTYPLKPIHDCTFLGTENSVEKPIVLYDGRIEGWFDPAEHVPWIRDSVAAGAFEVGLVDGYLPAIVYSYRHPESKQTCTMTAFAADTERAGKICLYVRVSESIGSPRYFRLKADGGSDAASFESALRRLREWWEAFFRRGALPACEDELLLNVCKASIVRALITFTGKHPHYGVKAYSEKRHDGFPPTILALTNCLLDWGQVDTAQEYLMYYFEHFVSADGRFDYYGPSLAEYGQMLTLVRRLYDRCVNRSWFETVRPKVEKICEWLWRDIVASKSGLISGVPEADTRTEVDIYLHNNAWCWRGLRDVSSLVGKLDWAERCEAFRKAIRAAIEAATDTATDPPFIPPLARRMAPFRSMVQDQLASYTNYRYWLELLSSGILSPEQMGHLIAYRRGHDGDVAGMTHFMNRADNWPIAEYAAALLELGRTQECRNVLFSHIAGHMTPGTWTAYEQVSIETNAFRRSVAPYCVPVQLAAPRILAWLCRTGSARK